MGKGGRSHNIQVRFLFKEMRAGVRGKSPLHAVPEEQEERFCFLLSDQMGLIACSTRNKKRCEVIGYESIIRILYDYYCARSPFI